MSIYNLTLTGHRPNKLDGYNLNTPFYKKLQATLEGCIETALSQHEFVVCRSGLALGADTVWSEAALAMKARYPNRVFFYAYEAFTGVEERWRKENQDQFHQHKRSADYVHTTDYGKKERSHTACAAALNRRNVDMIEPCNTLIAIWDGTRGGTGNAVRDAERLGKHIYHIHPDTLR